MIFLKSGLAGSRHASRTDLCMGTIVTQEVFGPHAERAAVAALREIRRLEDLLSRFKPRSDISKLNRMAGKKPVRVGTEALEVLTQAIRISEMSGGAFDITLGPVVAAWAITSEHPAAPPQGEVAELARLVDFRALRLDKEARTAYLPLAGQMVDLGGIGKGFAADMAARVYRRCGIRSAVLDLGGNVIALGAREDGSPWNVGIQDPHGNRGECLAVLETIDKSVVTSGNYERYFEEDGARYHHIIDPATGYPAESGLLSVTVVSLDSVTADGLSTAAFVLGLDKGLDLIRRAGVEAVFVTLDRRVIATGGLRPTLIPARPDLALEFRE